MARPLQEAIDTFISITGADEAVAVRKLEEHGGDLNRAINSHFNDGDSILNGISQNTMPTSHDDMMDLDGPLDNTFQRSLFPENFRDPFALMDPNFQHQFFDRVGSTDGVTRGPLVSHPREVREIPIEVKDSDPQTSPSGQAPVIEDVTGHESSNGLEVHETIIIDDEDSGLLSAPSAPHASVPSNTSSEPTAPPLVHVNDYDDDIEEEMIRAAIEASKKDSEGLANIAEQGDQHQEGVNLGEHSSDKAVMRTTDGIVERQVLASGKAGTSRQPIDEESFQEETEDVEEQPLVRRRSRRAPSENTELAQMPHPGASPVLNNHQSSGGDFPSEWGGISSEEHDEAVMLEAAMFGGVFGRPMHPFSMPSHRSSTYYPQITHSSSPALAEQRLLREQQDDEYLASLQADQEKELKALQDAELHRLEETTTREVALKKQKQEQEERRKKQLEEEELESSLASKQASLPSEPPPDAEGAVTVVVRMPDGSRQGRCFLKTDKLKFLFDFLDIGRICKPGTYRLVIVYH
uniref:UBX domain-containing protein n=1 Tax=Zea mays TaxID=4577 RepID=A0A804MQ19_MAIZE